MIRFIIWVSTLLLAVAVSFNRFALDLQQKADDAAVAVQAKKSQYLAKAISEWEQELKRLEADQLAATDAYIAAYSDVSNRTLKRQRRLVRLDQALYAE